MYSTGQAAGLVALAASLSLTASALAQPVGPPPGNPAPIEEEAYSYHRGIMVGFGVGIASASPTDCDGCESENALGVDFHLGGFINPRLALMYDATAWVDSEDEATLVLSTNTLAAQYWLAPRLWIKGGLGTASVRLMYQGDSESESGSGVTAAIGYEITTGAAPVDISARLCSLDFDSGGFTITHLLVGFRWK